MKISDPGALLAGDEVHVWHGVVSAEPADSVHLKVPERDLAVLSAAERTRFGRFIRPGDRVRFAAAHAAVRRLLGHYLGADPAAIRLGRTPCCKCGSVEHGRPRIEWPATDLNHNLSRSGEHWLLGVALGRPIGVDVECHRDIDIDRMSNTVLTRTERSYLDAQSAQARFAGFFCCWTRKEAVVKACGVGLATDLSALEVLPQQHTNVRVAHSSGGCPDCWLVQDLPGGPGWSAALAQPARQVGPVQYREYPSE